MQPSRRDAIVISGRSLRLALLALVVLLVGVVAFTQRDRLLALGSSAEAAGVDHRAYQAVFLVSSQVFFGRLEISGDTYLLSDVYYLATPPEGSQKGQLIKRGNELHGPREPMVIPARSVLFFENLRDDSEVLSAIRGFKSGQTPTPPNAPTPTATARPSPSRTP